MGYFLACASRVRQALPEAAGNGWQGSRGRQGNPWTELAMEPEGGQGKADLGDALLFQVLQQASWRPCATLVRVQCACRLIGVYTGIDMRPSVPVEVSCVLLAPQ